MLLFTCATDRKIKQKNSVIVYRFYEQNVFSRAIYSKGMEYKEEHDGRWWVEWGVFILDKEKDDESEETAQQS